MDQRKCASVGYHRIVYVERRLFFRVQHHMRCSYCDLRLDEPVFRHRCIRVAARCELRFPRLYPRIAFLSFTTKATIFWLAAGALLVYFIPHLRPLRRT